MEVSWKRIMYVFFVVCMASISGLAGASAGGYAIPANYAGVIAQPTMEKGYVSRPYLGVRWQLLTPQVAANHNLPVEWGVFISEVVAFIPASRADIRRIDILTRMGETTLKESHSYLNALLSHQPGDQVNPGLVRVGETFQVQVGQGEMNSG